MTHDGKRDPGEEVAAQVDLLMRSTFAATKSALVEARKTVETLEDTGAATAIANLSRLLLPWLYIAGTTIDNFWCSAYRGGDIVAVPAGLVQWPRSSWPAWTAVKFCFRVVSGRWVNCQCRCRKAVSPIAAREFTPFGRSSPVYATGTPLVIITTNEERTLPDAFVRRCLVLRLKLPAEETALIEFLMDRGRAHFREAADERVLRAAAELLRKDREAAIAAQVRPRPGQAEYLDLVRAVLGLEPKDAEAQIAMLGVVAEYTLGKHTRTDDAG